MPEIIQNIDPMDFSVFDESVQEKLLPVDYTTVAEIVQAFNEWAAAGRQLNPDESPFHDCLTEKEQQAVVAKAAFRIKELRRNREDQWQLDWDTLNLGPFYDD